jgi:hypothetical protein
MIVTGGRHQRELTGGSAVYLVVLWERAVSEPSTDDKQTGLMTPEESAQ